MLLMKMDGYDVEVKFFKQHQRAADVPALQPETQLSGHYTKYFFIGKVLTITDATGHEEPFARSLDPWKQHSYPECPESPSVRYDEAFTA